MFGTVAVGLKSLDEYTAVVGEEEIHRLREAARLLRGLRVLNLSVTAFGTDVAELLAASVPLLRDLGLACDWEVVRSPSASMKVYRTMYRALGGTPVKWAPTMTDQWLRTNAMNAPLLEQGYDVIIVHDPQPAALRSFAGDADQPQPRWILHSHLDLSSAQPDVWQVVRGHLARYDEIVLPTPAFAPPDAPAPVSFIQPAIDPLGPRNMDLPADTVRGILRHNGIRSVDALVSHVAPCEPASDFLGAIEACVEARADVPSLQLVLIPLTAPHDAAAQAYYDQVAARASRVEGIHLLTALSGAGNVELNAFQRTASVVMQKGLRRGFGLWLADALWKKRPVVSMPAPGVDELIIHGESGLQARTVAEFAAALRRLLLNRQEANQLAAAGHERIRRKFLITRYLGDVLALLTRLAPVSLLPLLPFAMPS